jgi:putative aldouronate transport system permease protein
MSMLYIRSDYMQMYALQYVLINIERNMEFLRQSSDFISATVSVDRLPLESTRMALVVLVVLPIACAYPFFQQYFVSGLTIGAVKG